jgi:hypothetical protein
MAWASGEGSVGAVENIWATSAGWFVWFIWAAPGGAPGLGWEDSSAGGAGRIQGGKLKAATSVAWMVMSGMTLVDRSENKGYGGHGRMVGSGAARGAGGRLALPLDLTPSSP